ncbi:MAG TPA: T9SS type A sorting domain-containing protein, partial [Aquaticitalea sp.]|nr:T9SS type A sorting domain-containing protein [Aquaticitalea sp.]
ISDAFTISDIKTHADITHPNIGQVNILFWFPWSTALNTGIWYNNTSCTNADMDKWFDLAGISATCDTNGGDPFLPYSQGNFNSAIGNNSAGEWRIYFKDVVVDGSGGYLNTFTIQLCREELVPTLSTESFDFNDLSVYPNPNNGTFNIKMDARSNNVKIGVYDMRGRQILLNDYATNGGRFDQSIDLQNAQSGVYLLTIQDDNRKVTKKIIVE